MERLHIISLKQGIKYGNLALILCCLLSDEWFRKYRYKKNGQTPKIIWLPEPVHALEVEWLTCKYAQIMILCGLSVLHIWNQSHHIDLELKDTIV